MGISISYFFFQIVFKYDFVIWHQPSYGTRTDKARLRSTLTTGSQQVCHNNLRNRLWDPTATATGCSGLPQQPLTTCSQQGAQVYHNRSTTTADLHNMLWTWRVLRSTTTSCELPPHVVRVRMTSTLTTCCRLLWEVIVSRPEHPVVTRVQLVLNLLWL